METSTLARNRLIACLHGQGRTIPVLLTQVFLKSDNVHVENVIRQAEGFAFLEEVKKAVSLSHRLKIDREKEKEMKDSTNLKASSEENIEEMNQLPNSDEYLDAWLYSTVENWNALTPEQQRKALDTLKQIARVD